MMKPLGMSALAMVFVSFHALAAPIKVAVADFDYVDTSGEVRDQTAAHQARLQDLRNGIISELGQNGRFTAVPLKCAAARCSVDDLDQATMTKDATAENAQFVVFGSVHKISSLIQFGQIDAMNVATGKTALTRAITFRGDSENAWQHATAFIGQMLADAIH